MLPGSSDRFRIRAPGFDAILTYGIVAPAGTPRPIVERLNAALRTALATDEVNGALPKRAANRCRPRRKTRGRDRREETKWSAMIKSAGLKGE